VAGDRTNDRELEDTAMKNYRIRTHQKGFSLAECMLSVAITGSTLLAVIGLLAGGVGGARDAKTETIAGILSRRMTAEAKYDMKATPLPALPLARYFLWDEAMQTLETSRTVGGLEGEYQGGSSRVGASLIGKSQISLSPNLPGVFHLEITIESPAAAPAGQRKVHRYETLVSP
jgi:type II secretory pathway pseudopilin PulG